MAYQSIKTISGRTHSDDDRNGRKLLLVAALDKALHNGGCRSGLASLHAAMCFINNEIQPVSFFSCSIFNGFPNRILSRIRMAAQITGLAKLLRIQEIDMTVLQNLSVKGFVGDHHTLVNADFICLLLNFLLGLFIQLRRVREPYKNCVWLFRELLRAVEDIFNQSRHDNCLAGPRRSLKRNYLRDFQHAIVIQCHSHAETHIIDRLLLEWE